MSAQRGEATGPERPSDREGPGEPAGRRMLEATFVDALRQTGALMHLMGQAAADEIGLNTTDLFCLNILSMSGPITAGQLAQKTGLTTASITGVIDRLEQAGYARRERDTGDRRRVVIHLEAARVMREVAPVFASVVKAWHELAAGYTDAELEFIVEFQQRAERLMREQVAKLRGDNS